MENVNTLDIDGTQWVLQDVEARNKIAVIENSLKTKVLEIPTITKLPGSDWTSLAFEYHYAFGKIHFINIRLENVSNTNIGTSETAYMGTLNIKPIRYTSFMLFDYVSGKTMRCCLLQDGQFIIGESNGVVSGNNTCLGELIFAEA